MAYTVKEIFLTLQGEGARAGRAAVFCRFAGCNLWSGREEDRAKATCQFCDTDFVGTDGPGGGRFADASALAAAITRAWGNRAGRPYVVCTGGEPLLQLDPPLIESLHAAGFEIGVESNGTIAPPPGIDWLCISPKAGTALLVGAGQELKVVVPQPGLDLEALSALDFGHFFLQPMAGPGLAEAQALAIRTCLDDPRWRLSLQTHKLIGIP